VKDIVRTWTRGNSTGIVIPWKVCRDLGIKAGSLLSLDVSGDGEIKLKLCGYREPWHGQTPHIIEKQNESEAPHIQEQSSALGPEPELLSWVRRIFKEK